MKAIRRTALAALALALALALAACSGSDAAGGGGEPVALAGILRDGVHAHDLMVDREDPERLWLGVHGGLYRSEDGGRRWTLAGLEGDDAMNSADAGTGPLWVAGHNVLERSDDGGESFASVEPDGLPNLDLHGFTTRAGHPDELLAAAAGEGLYRSRDGGESFELFSDRVGASVFGMSMTEDGTLYASDPQQGLIVSRDGKTFSLVVQAAGLTAVAAGPERSGLVLAGGQPGIVVSDDGGRRWRQTSRTGVAALAVAPSDPERAYAVGMDAVLYRSDDGGRNWSPVEEAEAS